MTYKSDEELLSLLRTAEAALAFEDLYDRYAQQLYRLAYQKTHAAAIASEIVQDIFISLWEKRENLLVSNLQHYLLSSVRYKAISHLRLVIAERKFTDITTVENTATQLTDYGFGIEEIQEALRQAIDKLPEKTKIVFEMSRYEQLSNKEIAQQLDLSEKAVEYHITQSIKHLRHHLQEFLLATLILLYQQEILV